MLALTLEERENPAHIELRCKFTEKYETVLGPREPPFEFMLDELTPERELFEDDDGKEGTDVAPTKEIEPTPNANNNYVKVDIMLPSGSEMSRGRVIGCKRDIDRNTAVRAPENQILDTREYTVQFDYGEVTELTENSIAKSMYAQCDTDGNQYVLLDGIIYFRNTNPVFSIEYQKIVVKGRASLRCLTVGWQVFCQ